MLCSDKTAAVLKRAGKSGLKTPVETSPKTSTAPTFLETTDTEGETSIAWTSGQEGWAKESSVKSMDRIGGGYLQGGLPRRFRRQADRRDREDWQT
jgi:hypothetical protein